MLNYTKKETSRKGAAEDIVLLDGVKMSVVTRLDIADRMTVSQMLVRLLYSHPLLVVVMAGRGGMEEG